MDEKIKVWSVKNCKYIEGCDILNDGRIVDKDDVYIDLSDKHIILNTTIKDVNNENIYEWDILKNIHDGSEYIIKYDIDTKTYILKPTIYLNNSILNPRNTFNFNKIYIDFLYRSIGMDFKIKCNLCEMSNKIDHLASNPINVYCQILHEKRPYIF